MTYTLHRLAAGSYDLVLDGIIVGSVVREVTADGGHRAWHAELLEDLPPDRCPSPFREIEHTFPTLDAATAWLGDAMVVDSLEAA
ncbi:hypothetical protein AFCDBAGC_0685 [Methylobacterium cerastii]|uniref:Uncharacterized protein n=1 Tax=Methylobacterium cerastii TaxID=932741 RepID=A0ABQ4QC95_9HYPH|nr:hypothetical protein [Methylobacterium cerastii]GJD42843.1 hypothetical protein AFCDBAGC_0685 [Methylobacterium cerastii]